jgi:hypothetical protein
MCLQCDTQQRSEKRNASELLIGKPKGKTHLEDLGRDGRIMLTFILEM